MEGAFCDGRANAVCDPVEGRRDDGFACREFGISRKTGYKIFEHYEECGLEGLSDRARRPFRYANQLPESVEAAIVTAKREKPHCGARKVRERLLRRLPQPFMPCSIAMGWSSPWTDAAIGPRERLVRRFASQRSLVHRLQGRDSA